MWNFFWHTNEIYEDLEHENSARMRLVRFSFDHPLNINWEEWSKRNIWILNGNDGSQRKGIDEMHISFRSIHRRERTKDARKAGNKKKNSYWECTDGVLGQHLWNVLSNFILKQNVVQNAKAFHSSGIWALMLLDHRKTSSSQLKSFSDWFCSNGFICSWGKIDHTQIDPEQWLFDLKRIIFNEQMCTYGTFSIFIDQ